MEKGGLIKRKVFHERSVRVEYSYVAATKTNIVMFSDTVYVGALWH